MGEVPVPLSVLDAMIVAYRAVVFRYFMTEPTMSSNCAIRLHGAPAVFRVRSD